MWNNDSFYTLLASNASTSAINTLSHFRNDLPERLRFQQAGWAVSLQTLAFDAKFLSETKKPNLIKVTLEQLKPSFAGSAFHQILAIVPFAHKHKAQNRFYHEVQRKEYFELLNVENPCFTILLTDENDKQLNLLSGQPTFVKLKFTKMSATFTPFMVRCESNASTHIYPANTNSDFRIDLPHPLPLGPGQWEVAVTSIHFPTEFNFGSLVAMTDMWIEFVTDDEDLEDMEQSERLFMEEDFFNYGKNLLKGLFQLISKSTFLQHLVQARISGKKRVKFECSEPLTIRASPELAYVLGIETEIKMTPDEEYISTYVIDVYRLIPHSLLVYCDIIKPIIVGSTYAKVIKLLPIRTQQEDRNMRFYESQHLDFVPIALNAISSFHFELRLANGCLIKFKKSDITVVNILIRRA